MDQYVDVAWYSVGEWGNLLQQKMKYFNDPAQYPPVFPVQQIDVGVVVVAVASLNAIGTHTHWTYPCFVLLEGSNAICANRGVPRRRCPTSSTVILYSTLLLRFLLLFVVLCLLLNTLLVS